MAGLADRLRRQLSGIAARAGGRDGAPGSERRAAPRSKGPHWAGEETDSPAGTGWNSAAAGGPRQPQKPFVTPYYVWGTLALLMAGFALGVLLWQYRQTLLPEAEVNRPLLGDPLSPLEEHARSELLKPAPELGAELKRSFLGKPEALCAELRSLGLENPGWKKAPFQTGRWQCASDLVPLTTPSVDFGSTTLFFLLRGPSEDKIDYLRLKLVVEDPKQKQIGLDAVWLVIDALAGRYGWTVPDSFRAAISDFRFLETIHRGVRLSVAPEDPKLTDDPLANQRLNIVLDFSEPDLIRPADRFEKAPPLESGWSAPASGGQ